MNDTNLREWWKRGLEHGATHLIVLFDVRTFTSVPIYVFPEESVISKITLYEKSQDLLILEVFTYAQEFEIQLLEKEIQ